MRKRQQPLRIRHDLRRALRAQWRDARVLLGESRRALTLFVLLMFSGSMMFYFFYIEPTSGQRISYPQALYSTFALLFFQGTLDFPEQWYLQLLYFILPILGLVAVVDGVVRFGSSANQ